jgi:hypothetical protein
MIVTPVAESSVAVVAMMVWCSHGDAAKNRKRKTHTVPQSLGLCLIGLYGMNWCSSWKWGWRKYASMVAACSQEKVHRPVRAHRQRFEVPSRGSGNVKS